MRYGSTRTADNGPDTRQPVNVRTARPVNGSVLELPDLPIILSRNEAGTSIDFRVSDARIGSSPPDDYCRVLISRANGSAIPLP